MTTERGCRFALREMSQSSSHSVQRSEAERDANARENAPAPLIYLRHFYNFCTLLRYAFMLPVFVLCMGMHRTEVIL
jgi:hypothetical protein